MIDAEMYYQHEPLAYKPTLRPLSREGEPTTSTVELNEDELVLCSRVLRGFSFKLKKWSEQQRIFGMIIIDKV
jgi:hypothetical protein